MFSLQHSSNNLYLGFMFLSSHSMLKNKVIQEEEKKIHL